MALRPSVVVKVIFENETKTVSIKDEVELIKIIEQLDKNPEDYLTILNGEVVTEFELVKNEDTLKLVRVWSGG